MARLFAAAVVFLVFLPSLASEPGTKSAVLSAPFHTLEEDDMAVLTRMIGFIVTSNPDKAKTFLSHATALHQRVACRSASSTTMIELLYLEPWAP